MRKIIAMHAAMTPALAAAFASQPDAAPAPAPAAATPKAPRVEPQIAGVASGITMPARKSAGRGSSPYPFDSLEVGQAFGVKNKDKRAMSSIVSNANKKFRDTATGADGQPVTIQTKHFAAFDVDVETKKNIKGTPLEGSTVLVFRDK